MTLNESGNSVGFLAGISAADVKATIDAAGDLLLTDGIAGDLLTVTSDYVLNYAGVVSRVGTVSFADDANGTLGNTGSMPFTWEATTGTPVVLHGSNYGSNRFVLTPDVTSVVAGNNSLGATVVNTFVFGRGSGTSVADMNGGTGRVQLGAGIRPEDVVLEAQDGSDALTVRLRGTTDNLTFTGDLVQTVWGTYSRVQSLAYTDGSTADLGMRGYNAGKPLALTVTGDAVHTALTGSGWGTDTFLLPSLALGSADYVVTGGTGALGGTNENTYLVGRGIGHATIRTPGSWATLSMASDIAPSDVLLGSDGTDTNLVVTFRDDPADSITVENALFPAWGGISSSMKAIRYANGGVQQVGVQGYGQGAQLRFTWVGDAVHTSFTGSAKAFNIYELGAGGDTITAAPYGTGVDWNLFKVGTGIGHAQVNMNGGYGEVVLDATITRADLLLQAHDDGSLTMAFRHDPSDSITFSNALNPYFNHTYSRIGRVTFASGESIQVGNSPDNTGLELVNTWNGQMNGTALHGAATYGSNVFELGHGVTSVTSGWIYNAYLFHAGDGAVFVNAVGARGDLYLTDLLPSQVSLSADGDGSLTLTRDASTSGGSGVDSITFGHVLQPPAWTQNMGMTFTDGTRWERADIASVLSQAAGAAGIQGNTVTGALGADVLLGTGGRTLVGAGGQDTYIVKPGDGQVNVVNGTEHDYVPPMPQGKLFVGGTDRPSDLWFERSGDDLHVSVLGTADGVTVHDWFGTGAWSRLSSIVAGDGSMLHTDTGLTPMLLSMNAYAGAHPGFSVTTTSSVTDAGVQAAVSAAWNHA